MQKEKMMSLNDTPRAGRLHIGIYGRRNAGKSSLINALTGQDIALVSDAPGTTTDPIYKSMELHPVGPVVFIDTAGFDDEGTLGRLRVERTAGVVDKTDVGIIVIDNEDLEKAAASSAAAPADAVLAEEKLWAEKLAEKNVPLIFVLNKCDEMQAPGESGALTESCGSTACRKSRIAFGGSGRNICQRRCGGHNCIRTTDSTGCRHCGIGQR